MLDTIYYYGKYSEKAEMPVCEIQRTRRNARVTISPYIIATWYLIAQLIVSSLMSYRYPDQQKRFTLLSRVS